MGRAHDAGHLDLCRCEQTAKQSVTFHIEARNSDPNRIVELQGPASDGRLTTNFEIRAELSGPQARLQQVREKLLSSAGALAVDIDPNVEPGSHLIASSLLLADNPIFVKNGLSVTNLTPDHVHVVVDPIDRQELTVMTSPAVTTLEAPAIFDPPKVWVSGPHSVLEAARRQGKLTVYAELGKLTDAGAKSLPNVPVTLPVSNPHLTIMPNLVSAKVLVRNSETQGIVKAMPIWAIYPPSPLWDKYKAEPDSASIFDVKVTGPAEMIRDINDPAFESKPKAIFDVTAADPPIGTNPAGTKHEAHLRFDFGNTGLKISPDEQRKVSFTISERRPD